MPLSKAEKNWRKRRRKWVRPLTVMIVWEAYERIREMPRRQAIATLQAMESCTITNCWFGDYECAKIFIPILRSKLILGE